jgi:hypothetical protein
MPKKYFLLLLLISFYGATKATAVAENDTIPHLKNSDVKMMFADIVVKSKVTGTAMDTVEYTYEKRWWDMAGAKMGIDNEETAKKKIQLWWDKYKTSCTFSTVGFNVENGNILKYAVCQSFLDFIETMVLNYDLDINFIDPADNRNLLDYVNDEIERLKHDGVSKTSVEVYNRYRLKLIALGAKTSK